MEDIARYAKTALVMNKATLFAHDTVLEIFKKSEEIEKMGLSVPQVCRVFQQLEAAGMPMDDQVYTIGYGVDQVLKRLAEKEGLDVT